MSASVTQIETKLHPDAIKIAEQLEILASSIRSGKTPTSCIWYIHMAPNSDWIEVMLGDIWISQLLGYIERAKFSLLRRQDDKDLQK